MEPKSLPDFSEIQRIEDEKLAEKLAERVALQNKLAEQVYIIDQEFIPPDDGSLLEDLVHSLNQLPVEDLMALNLILTERVGQIQREGMTPEHDDHHKDGELALASAAFAKAAADEIQGNDVRCPAWWPWSKKWFKPYGFQRNLERSGALLIAEISRMLRT